MKTTITVLVSTLLFVSVGPADAQNVDFISGTLYGGSLSSIKVAGDYAYGAANGSLQIVSLADPADPISHGGCILPYSGRDIFIADQYVYIAYGEDTGPATFGGIYVVDISDPFSSTIIGGFETDIEFHALTASDNHAYIATWNALWIFDISDPVNPEPLSQYDATTSDVFVIDDYLYATAWSEGLFIYDISDPEEPILIGSCDTYGNARSLFVSDGYAYIAASSHGLWIIDISDPTDPFVAAVYDDQSTSYDVHIDDHRAYVVGGASVHILDITDPTNPLFLGGYTIYGYYDLTLYGGNKVIIYRPAFGSSDGPPSPSSFIVLDVSDPEDILSIGSYYPPAPSTAHVFNDNAYVAGGDGGLQVLNVSSPGIPEIAGHCNTVSDANGVYVLDDRAYIASGYCYSSPWGTICFGGLEIFDVSEPSNPLPLGDYPWSNSFTDIFVSENYAYVVYGSFSSQRGIFIFDISDPAEPIQINNIENANDIFVIGNTGYLARNGSLDIIDFSDPEYPSVIGIYEASGIVYRAVYVDGEYVYLADDNFSLQILDVSDPSAPAYIGEYDSPGHAWGVTVSGNYAFLIYTYQSTCGLQVIDISNPENPVLAGSYDFPGYANSVFVEDEYIYLPHGSALTILRFDPQTGIIEEVSTPENFSLSQNYPNPFNASTSISFTLPEPGDVRLTVYDLLGRQVATLLDDYSPAGTHKVTFDASDYSSGVYLYRVQAGDMVETKRMLLLK